MTSVMTLALPYGLRDLKITPYNDLLATELSDTTLTLPYIQTFHFSDVVNFSDIPGSYETLTNSGAEQGGTWTLGAGGIALNVLAALSGADLTTDGWSPQRYTRYLRNLRQVRPWVRIEGQSLSDDSGDVHGTVYRCRAIGEIAGEFTDSAFYITSLSGIFLPANTVANDGDLFDITRNETAQPIPVAPW